MPRASRPDGLPLRVLSGDAGQAAFEREPQTIFFGIGCSAGLLAKEGKAISIIRGSLARAPMLQPADSAHPAVCWHLQGASPWRHVLGQSRLQ